MQAIELILTYGNKKLSKKISNESIESHLLKKLEFTEGDVKITLYLKKSFLDLDSDVKYQAINQVINTPFHYLKKNDKEILRHTFHVIDKKQS